MRKLFALVLIAVALALTLGPRPAVAATTLVVDDDGIECPGAGYTTVQDAVDAALPGDTISVCDGTYAEQVTITTDDLTLRSATPLGAVIQAPAVPLTGFKALVHVNGAVGITIDQLTISGPGPGTCDSLRTGIRIDGGGSATIEDNLVMSIRDQPLSGCQTGVGILVGRRSSGDTGTAKIRNNTISDYQKGGIVVDNTGSSAEVTGNVVTGALATFNTAQNGIQVSRGAVAVIRGNDITGNWYSGSGWSATGLLIFESSGVMAQDNTISGNQVGVGIETWCWALFAGDIPSQANGNNVVGNTINGSDYGVVLDALDFPPYSACDASANNNKVVNNVISSPGAEGVEGIFVGTADYGGAFTPSAVNNKVINNQISGFTTPIVTSGDAETKVHANASE